MVEEVGTKVAIDPGQNCYIFDFRSLIPEEEWPRITHVVIDPDHHWQSDRVAEASGAPVVCGVGLTRTENGQTLIVDSRGKALTSWVPFDNLHPLDVGDSITLEGVTFETVRAVHGPIEVSLLGFKIRKTPGPRERTGLGAIGFNLSIGDKTVLNLGDRCS